MGSSCKYGWSFARSPAAHLLLCSPGPNRPWTSSGQWLRVGDPWLRKQKNSIEFMLQLFLPIWEERRGKDPMASGVMGKAPERSLCLHPTVSTLLPTYLKIPLPLAQLVKNPPAMQETPVQFLGREDPLERDRLPTPVFLGFPGGSAGKESTCSAGDLGSIPGLGRFPGKEYMSTHSSILAWRIPWTV